MDKGMELLLSKLDEKLNQQTTIITTSITKNVMEALDEKMKIITEENKNLKTKICELEQKIFTMEKEKRKNNLIFFGIEENGETECELVDIIKEHITEMGVHLESHEICNIYRIGQKSDNKIRPVVVSFSTIWKKHTIQRNKSSLPPNIRVVEDYPKDVLEKRKQLQLQVEEEKKKGNIAYLKYDKLIVKQSKDINREKRKRVKSGSPNSSTQKKANISSKSTNLPPKTTPKEIIRPNILNYVERGRSASLTEIPKNL